MQTLLEVRAARCGSSVVERAWIEPPASVAASRPGNRAVCKIRSEFLFNKSERVIVGHDARNAAEIARRFAKTLFEARGFSVSFHEAIRPIAG